jgi:adenylate cyclase
MLPSTAAVATRPIPVLARLRELVLGPPLPARLPRRVQEAVRREQDDSEIIVTLIQFVAIGTFAVLYSLTPKAFPPTVPFEPVPMALAAYAVFTVVRFALAIRRRLPGWFLSLSVVVDIAFLMLTIWSFHLQYQAPPAIYFKAPTLMYAFILIALRTLCFEPRYVILGGAAAALGWLTLVAYALFGDGQVMRTRSFDVYATSHSVLLGAEFDKVVSILMVTAILALALHRARTLLARAVTEQQAVAGLSRFFAPEIAGRITGAEMDLAPGQAELRGAAILFVDLRGFTPLSERLAPAGVMRLLSDYQARMVRAIRAEGGSIDKFMGDGILASFGATRPSATYAADAVRALEGVVDAAAAWAEERSAAGEPPLAIGAALASGPIMFGTVGDAERLEYTVIGEPVNLAAKLEKHCKKEAATAVLPAAALDAAAAQGCAARLPWQLRPGREVAGVVAPVDLAVLPANAA